MTWYSRKLQKKILQAAEMFPAVALAGARQTGKTSLLKKLFPTYNAVSLDLPSVAELAEKDPQGFLKRYPPPVLIDEVQYAPALFRHLKLAIDNNRHEMGRFILTGSQQFQLMRDVGESLAGRIAIMELETLSVHEVTQHQPAPQSISQYGERIYRGGFPELWRNTDLDPGLFYSSYLATYLERDVRQLINITSLRNFERFLRICATRNGQVLQKSSLASDVGVSVPTVSEWLSVLQASNQLVLLEPWYTNLGKRIVKSPKMYFADTGLLCHLLGIGKSDIEKTPFIGTIWECYVFAELRKQIAQDSLSARSGNSIWYYRDSNQLEVDFIVSGRGGQGQLIECKWNEFPGKSDAKNLVKLRNIIQKKSPMELSTVSSHILCRTPDEFRVDADIFAVSLSDYKMI
ncbi:MAG: ATP-binding protein [Deltaproteobacteria bacterium]|nr:ATP-binding protein [Deltaproteobacteria bacterium]MBN2673786.1 ATP-binding protein [Deltaproteobacteria bacterium]